MAASMTSTACDALPSGRCNAVNDDADERGDPHGKEEQILAGRISDQALEAALRAPTLGVPTVFHLTYCFSCPA
jgi:hypothetical protein